MLIAVAIGRRSEKKVTSFMKIDDRRLVWIHEVWLSSAVFKLEILTFFDYNTNVQTHHVSSDARCQIIQFLRRSH